MKGLIHTTCAFILTPMFLLAQNHQQMVEPVGTPQVTIKLMDTAFNNGLAVPGISYFTSSSVIMAKTPACNTLKKGTVSNTDLYISSTNEEGIYESPVRFEGVINSNANEAPGSISTDRKSFYFTRWTDASQKDCKIFVSRMFNRKWMEATEVELVNVDGYRSMQPTFTPDGIRFYFVSDRPGGLGGLDIWFVSIDSEGNWSEPQNMGVPINTTADESSPFYHAESGTFFFSSNGQPEGLGGMDIYKSRFSEEENNWSTPFNLGAPVNSSFDDEHYMLDFDQVSGFFTSTRLACATCDKKVKIPGRCPQLFAFEKPVLRLSLAGYVYDAETEEGLPGVMVVLKDVRGAIDPIHIITDDQGHYVTELPQDRELFIKTKKPGYFADAGTVKTLGLTESSEQEQDFFLRPMPKEDIELSGILFEDKGEIKAGSSEALDKLQQLMAINEGMGIEIYAHTSCRGDEEANLKISNVRAQACMDYLVAKGIRKERLTAIGKGETEPLAGLECTTIDREKDKTKAENMHQRNNRITYRITGNDGNGNNEK